MDSFRKQFNSDIVLLSLGLFVVAFGVAAVFLIHPVGWFVAGIGVILATAGGVWGKRWVEFDEAGITTQYLTKQILIPWSEVAQSKFENIEGNHTVHLDLRNGKKYSLPIQRKEVRTIERWINQRATLDPPTLSLSNNSTADDSLNSLVNYGRPIFLLILGAFLAWLSIRMCVEVYNGSRATAWPTAEGLVTSSNVKVETKTSGRRIKRKTTYYEPVITYEYKVDGKQYQGDRVSFSPFKTTDRNEAYEFSHDFITNPEINVRYDPAKPSESVLLAGIETERKFVTGLMALGSLAAFGFGGYHLLALRRESAT